jgi:ferrous iron transport protein B
MQDDAARRGIRIDCIKLEEAIGMPVVETIGRSSKSTKKLLDVFTSTVMSQYEPSEQIKAHIANVQRIEAGEESDEAKREAIIEARYALIDSILAAAVDRSQVSQSARKRSIKSWRMASWHCRFSWPSCMRSFRSHLPGSASQSRMVWTA